MIGKSGVSLLALGLYLSTVAEAHAQNIEHVYVVNETAGSISLYDMSTVTGTLVSSGTFAGPPLPIHLCFNPAGTYAYLTSAGQNPAITSFSVNPNTGALTQVASLALNAGALPFARVDPSGNYLFTFDLLSHSIATYGLNSNGSLEAADSLALPNSLSDMDFSPASGVLYASGPASVLTQLAFSSSGAVSITGATPLTSLPLTVGIKDMQGKHIALQPSGKYLYVIDPLAGTITGFSVNPTSGALTEFGGDVYSFSGFSPGSFAFAASGNYLYLSSWSGGGIIALRSNSDGTLSAIPNTSMVIPFQSASMRFDNVGLASDLSGNFLYAINGDTSQITGYSVNSTTGALTQISGLPLATGSGPAQVVFVP